MKLKYQSEEYQKGFNAATSLFKSELEYEIGKLTTFPVLTERRIAMVKMLEVIDKKVQEKVNE